jgi:integrase
MRTNGEHDPRVPASSPRVRAIPAESRDHFARRLVARAPGIFHRRMCAGNGACTRRDLCCHLKVLLRFCHREGISDRDLRGAVGMPQVYRLADVPRSITWDEVRRTLDTVDRRTIRGRRDYAILLFLVTYGLRAPRGRQTHAGRYRLETRAIPSTGTQGWPRDCVSACRSCGRSPDRLSQTR